MIFMKLIYFATITIVFIACNSSQKNNPVIEQERLTLKTFLTKHNSYVEVPMEQLKSGHLSVVTKVNNVKGHFILDTGSSSTIIDHKHKKKFRLVTKHTPKIAKTAGGLQLKMKVSYDNVMDFGQLKLRNVKISLVNLSHINHSFQKMGMLQLDGILGSDILKNRKAVIDYDNLLIYFKKN